MKRLLLALFLAFGCAGPGMIVDFDGNIQGHMRTDSSTWLVAVGIADADLSTQIPPGVIVALPIVVHAGHWMAINLRTGEILEAPIVTPLPTGPAGLYAPGEWDLIVGGFHLQKE